MEKNLTQCKKCLQYKDKIHQGYYKNKNKRFVDALAFPWCGRLCYDCNTERLKLHMRNKRSNDLLCEAKRNEHSE